MADTPEEVQKHLGLYVKVGAALFVFTVITWAISYVDFGSMAANYTVGLGIALFKASLVALIFMHLNHEKKLIYKILLFTVVFVIGLGFLTMLGGGDPHADPNAKSGYQEDGAPSMY